MRTSDIFFMLFCMVTLGLIAYLAFNYSYTSSPPTSPPSCVAVVYEGGFDGDRHFHQGERGDRVGNVNFLREEDGTVIYLPTTAEVVCGPGALRLLEKVK